MWKNSQGESIFRQGLLDGAEPMVAISLAKLRFQIEQLKSRFADPHHFFSALKAMLELYSDQSYHPQAEKRPYRIDYYQIPPIIIRQLDREFQLIAGLFPAEAIQNAHLLWQDQHYESKVLAARLLGSISAEFSESVINEIHEWQTSGMDSALINELLEIASKNIREDHSGALLKQIKDWLISESLQKVELGLKGLQVIVNDPHFENLPTLLAIFSPLIENPSEPYVTESIRLYQQLIDHFPDEMEVFSRKVARRSKNYFKQKILRKAFSAFPPDKSKSLKLLLPPLKF